MSVFGYGSLMWDGWEHEFGGIPDAHRNAVERMLKRRGGTLV
jgi:cation transport regulator ChaC